MTAISPRLPIGPFRKIGNPFARLGRSIFARLERREQLARPPAYVVLCATVTVLNIVGLVMILSASSVAALSDYGSSWYFFDRQLIWAVGGAAAFIAASSVDYHVWKRLAPLLFVVSIAGLLVVLIPGVGIMVDGSRRWLGAGAFRVQPSELAKLALLCCAANVLARRADRLDDWKQWFPVLLMLGGLGGLVMLEPDLDSVIVLALIGFALLIVGGVRRLHLARLAAMGIGLVTVLAFAAPYRRARMLAFMHPWEDQRRTGYQIAQSLIALGSGGVDGVGLGAGRAKWLFLPNAHTDFIFAVIAEEYGVLACLVLIALFGLVAVRVFSRHVDQSGSFAPLAAAGLTLLFVVQAIINMAVNVGLVPAKGMTLPFISSGGSSMLAVGLAMGMLLAVTRRRPDPGRVKRPEFVSRPAT
jgi:cell division protein FtsW